MTNDTHEELLRQRYLADLVATATPAQRLLMLFDYLKRDLAQAAEAFGGRDWKAVNDSLVHAEHIVFALRDPLDRSSELGASLGGVYDFCLEELIACNLEKDEARLAPVRELIDELAEANATAMASAATAAPAAVGA